MKKLFFAASVALLLVAGTGCTTNQGHFTVISSNIVDLDNIDLQTKNKLRNVRGESSSYTVFMIPFGELNPNPESAMQDAFSRTDTDLFVNAQLDYSFFWIPCIWSKNTVSVEGEAVKTRK